MKGIATSAQTLVFVPALLATLMSLGLPPSDPAVEMLVISDGPPPAATLSQAGIRPAYVFSAVLDGFAARLTQRQLRVLAAQAWVTELLPDDPIAWTDDGETGDATPAPDATPLPTPEATPLLPLPRPGPDLQIVPTGLSRIGRPNLEELPIDSSDQRVDVDIAILDTGVDLHPDLNVVGGHDCTHSRRGWRDNSKHGHGTHVAGTAAALDNGFGVVGVAPGARIWSVKVLDANGNGRTSWLLCGIDWVAQQRDDTDPSRALIEVANMSLRFKARTTPADDGNCGYTPADPIHRAICAATQAGTIFVVAAGNDARNAARYRPGAYREVITVSALADFDGQPGATGARYLACPKNFTGDRDDRLLRVSNWGPAIDIMAPGKCIWSTSRNGRYRAMSGTSMATPHVAGAVALYRALRPSMTFEEIRTALANCATIDWRVNSDRDATHEGLLNLARLCN